jgi:hypothetical protein
MKNTILLAFALATVALGILCIAQSRRLADQNTQLAARRAEAEQQSRDIADLQAAQTLLGQQREELLAQASQLAAKLQTPAHAPGPIAAASLPETAAATNAPKSAADKNPFGQFLAKMMDDPETKKLIRQQQRAMLDQSYSPLVKQMGLQPDEAEQFKDLLADNMAKGAEKATALLGGESATNRAELMAKLAEEQKGFEEQVRSFLGESRYAQYQDYQQTVGERTQLNQFRQQLAGDNAVTDQQTEQLLAFMKEAKQAGGGLDQPQDAASMQAMLSGEGIEKLLQNQEASGRQVYERARGVLSESQLAAFGRFQTNQSQMMRMGMSMARKFMSPEQTPGTAATP